MNMSSQSKFVYDLNFKFTLYFIIRKLNKVKKGEKLGVTKRRPP